MGLVLDSSVVIDLLRGRVVDGSVLTADREPVMISTITVHEVRFGLRDGEAAATSALLDSFVVVPLGAPEAELSARWRREYRTRGVTLDISDTGIAATAALRGVPLMTGNAKHLPMPGLHLEHWA